MSKLALLICADNPADPNGTSSEADAAAFGRALRRYWSFDESEIVFLSSNRNKGEIATRADVERQFEKALKIEDLESLIVGFWGAGVCEPGTKKRRFCLANFNFLGGPDKWFKDLRNTTVSLGSLLSATIRVHARNACFIFDCRTINSEGNPCALEVEDRQTILRYIRKTEPGYRCCALAACSAGERPIDSVPGRRGLFTSNLIEGIGQFANSFQSSFDSVVGYTVQQTQRASESQGTRQFPFVCYAGDGDIRFEITPGYSAGKEFDAYEAEEENESLSVLFEDSTRNEETSDRRQTRSKTTTFARKKIVAIVVAAVVTFAVAIGVAFYFAQ